MRQIQVKFTFNKCVSRRAISFKIAKKMDDDYDINVGSEKKKR